MTQRWLKSRSALVVACLLWLVIAFAGLPFAWHAAVTRWLAYGPSARPYWAIAVAALVVALAIVSRWLSAITQLRCRPFTIALAGAAWCAVHAACWQWQASSLADDPTVVVLYVATTGWIAWCGAMWFSQYAVASRATLLAISFVPVAVWTISVHSGGLDGQGRPIVNWRFASEAQAAAWPTAVSDTLPLQKVAEVQNDYPAFRGRRGLGAVEGVKLATDWASTPPRQIWRRAVGSGWGGFAVVHGSAFTQEQRGADECVVCYEAATGRERWVHSDRACFTSTTAGDGPRATPSVFDRHVYSLGASGLLNCFDALSGNCHWLVDTLADNQASNLYHGLSGSPLVIGELVVVSVGGREHSMVAYNRRTGRRVWHAGTDPAGYGSPLACTLDGIEQIVILNRPGLASHNPATGEVLWTFPWTNDQETNCSQPVPVGNDRLLVSTGYGKGCALIRVQQSAGGWLVETLWTSRQLRTKFASAVVRDGFAYGLDDGILSCIDLADGSRRWRAGRYGHGQVLLVGDSLLVECESGDVALVATDPTAHRELGRIAALAEKTWNYPVLAGSLLLVRNDREAACFDVVISD